MQQQSQNQLPVVLSVRDSIKPILRKYENAAKLIPAMNLEAMAKRYVEIRTVAYAYETKYITLAEINILYGNETSQLLIESWIAQLCLFYNLPLVADQVREIAWLIYDDYKSLNVAEMVLFFTRVKKGYYGQFYGRIDPGELLSWLRFYWKERGHYVAKLPNDYVSPVLEQAKQDFEKRRSNGGDLPATIPAPPFTEIK